MGYQVEFDALDAFYNRLHDNVTLWQQMLQATGEAAESLSKSGNMGGAGAENIRDYVAEMVSTYHPAGEHGSEKKGEAYREQTEEMKKQAETVS